ncbi:hypothetical protein LIER_09187 [Lithospermum erythrorhizon]|uniref:Calmodulin-binding protein n=1 Tax=Lithospermum erythrorhizon TaxID=34254 RepID=A0AAV3PET6_LITER
METEVMLPSPANELNFDSSSTCTTPYMSAPSSPQRLGTYTPFFSAPTSPTRISFTWEHKPATPESPNHTHENAADFAFDFSGQLDKHLYLPADELFHAGKIKPLKPPPCLNYESSPRSPRSPNKTFREAFSPRSSKTRDFDPFAEAFKNTSMEESQTGANFQRGRERKYTNNNSFSTNPSSRHNKTRSLSPFRVSDLLFDQETEQEQKTDKTSNSSSSSSWYKKWKLKDLLLFRSASEGRQTRKAQLKKYTVLKKNSNNNINSNEEDDDDLKNVSFRSVESSVGSCSSSVIASSRRRTGAISAHELHYTINRAVSEEMKRKTFLPYKQGLLGCLGFQPDATDISRGVGSITRA